MQAYILYGETLGLIGTWELNWQFYTHVHTQAKLSLLLEYTLEQYWRY